MDYYNIKNINYSYEDYQLAMKELRRWPFIGNWWQMGGVTCLYLLFVLKIGPNYMKNREPYNIRPIMLVYNLCQTFLNAWIAITMLTLDGFAKRLILESCNLPQPWDTPYYRSMLELGWYYMISKILDLFDTIFFVLRKKEKQVSFLHVYHHANMVPITWAYMSYVRDPTACMIAWLNSVVHAVMYSYYFLAALGPQVQKYLWWKKYITTLQMIQFSFIISYTIRFLLLGCKISIVFAYFSIMQTSIFLILFANFYIRSYVVKKTGGEKPMAVENSTSNDGKFLKSTKILEKEN